MIILSLIFYIVIAVVVARLVYKYEDCGEQLAMIYGLYWPIALLQNFVRIIVTWRNE